MNVGAAHYLFGETFKMESSLQEISGLREMLKDLVEHADSMAKQLDEIYMRSVAEGAPETGTRAEVAKYRGYLHDIGMEG